MYFYIYILSPCVRGSPSLANAHKSRRVAQGLVAGRAPIVVVNPVRLARLTLRGFAFKGDCHPGGERVGIVR